MSQLRRFNFDDIQLPLVHTGYSGVLRSLRLITMNTQYRSRFFPGILQNKVCNYRNVYLVVSDPQTNEDVGSLFVWEFAYLLNPAASSAAGANVAAQGYAAASSSSSPMFLPPIVGCGSRKDHDDPKDTGAPSASGYRQNRPQSPISGWGSMGRATSTSAT